MVVTIYEYTNYHHPIEFRLDHDLVHFATTTWEWLGLGLRW